MTAHEECTGHHVNAVILHTDGDMHGVTFHAESLADGIHEAVGGWMEVVVPPDLTADPTDGIIGVVNEEGRLRRLPLNLIMSVCYGAPIRGDVVFVRSCPDGEWRSLSDADFDRLVEWIALSFDILDDHRPSNHDRTN